MTALLDSTPTRYDWRELAACRDADGELFYLPDGAREDAPASVTRTAAAKAVCATCPVTSECLRWALEAGEDHGVWGATSPEDRRAMRRTALGMPGVRT